jgi:hypothetical protein
MKECKYENLIDDYLLNRLNLQEKEVFEEHYFNCTPCFQKVAENDEIISVVKQRGQELFKDFDNLPSTKKEPFYNALFAFFTPKQWAVTVASAAVLAVIFLAVGPALKTPSPQFFINEDLVRGESIILISPQITIETVPGQFKWTSLGKDVEYKIYIYNHSLIWNATTTNNYISLPDDIQKSMITGEKYSWEVKAFSPEGSLIAISSRVQFSIIKEE